MKTLTRYLIKDTLKPTVLALLLMSSIIWLLQSLRFMDYMVNKGLPFSDFLWMVALIMPYMLIAVFPLSLFAGTLYAFKRLNDDNEMHSLFAAGLSKWTVVWPSLVMAVIVSIICYITTLFLIPAGMTALNVLKHEISQGGGNFIIEERTFNPIGDDKMIFVQERLGRNNIQGIMIHDSSDIKKPVTWLAEEGLLSTTAEGMPQLKLINGTRQEIGIDSTVNVGEFDSYTIDLLTDKEKSVRRNPKPRELYLGELLKTEDKDAKTAHKYKAEFAKRLLWPLMPFAYVMIAGVLLVRERRNRSGAGKITAIAVVAGFAFQALVLTLDNLASKGNVTVLYVQWLLPIVVIILCALAISGVFRKSSQRRSA